MSSARWQRCLLVIGAGIPTLRLLLTAASAAVVTMTRGLGASRGRRAAHRRRTVRSLSNPLPGPLTVGSPDSGLPGGGLTAHRVLFGLLPLLIDLRVLPRERIRDRVGFLHLFLHPELVVRFGHVPPDSGSQGWAYSPRAGR